MIPRLQRVAFVAQAARAHRERLLVFLIPLILLAPAAIVAGTWRHREVVRAQVVTAEPEQAWRYLLVCGQCQHRERLTESPHRTWDKENGLFRCPQCAAFMADCYRRGSLTVPPGGW
jgi:hypothetical protein